MPDLLSGILGVKAVEVAGVSMIVQPDPTTGNVAGSFPVLDANAALPSVLVGTVNGALCNLKQISEEITIANAAYTDSTANLLPANSFIIGVVARVTTLLPNARTWQAGIAGTTAKFIAAGTAGALGTTGSSLKLATMLAPFAQQADAKVRITPSNADAAGGKIRVTVSYITLTEPAN